MNRLSHLSEFLKSTLIGQQLVFRRKDQLSVWQCKESSLYLREFFNKTFNEYDDLFNMTMTPQ